MTSEHLDVPQVLPHPSAPMTLEETGLSLDLLLQLTLKHMHFAGELTGSELARRLGLRFSAIEPAIHALKSQHQIAIIGGAMVGPASYRYRITDSGRTRVTIFLEHNPWIVVLQPYEDYGLRRDVEFTPNPDQQFELRRFNVRMRRAGGS